MRLIIIKSISWRLLKQCNLSQKISNKVTTKAILSSFMERLPQKREYLKACIGNQVFLKTHYCLPQRESRKANSNVFLLIELHL